ncbi:MAG: type I-F CRISPR-associated endoribonuclease Cas6/Csy4 [Colwellia sp.]|nr:type I-F CRISPR-associated endoribonuclease Cas6/Csy4 [Colwellia sp.]
MKHYLEITLLPDVEANLGFLWQKVYQQIHLALVKNKNRDGNSDIAVSFPGYGDKDFPLGDRLRLISDSKMQLQSVNIQQWLNRLSDYTHIKQMKPVPEPISQYAIFKRKQFKSNIEKKAQRRAAHLGKPYEEVLDYLLKENSKSGEDTYRCHLPFINMESLSSDKNDRFPLFIERALVDKPVLGMVNCYGLSKTATVPWF